MYEIKHTLNCECDNRWRIGLLGLTDVEEKEQQIEACLKNFRLQHQGSQVEGCEQSGCCLRSISTSRVLIAYAQSCLGFTHLMPHQ